MSYGERGWFPRGDLSTMAEATMSALVFPRSPRLSCGRSRADGTLFVRRARVGGGARSIAFPFPFPFVVFPPAARRSPRSTAAGVDTDVDAPVLRWCGMCVGVLEPLPLPPRLLELETGRMPGMRQAGWVGSMVCL